MSTTEFEPGDHVWRLIHVQDPGWCWRVVPGVIVDEPDYAHLPVHGPASEEDEPAEPHHHFAGGEGEFVSDSPRYRLGEPYFPRTHYRAISFERDVFATEAEAEAEASRRMNSGEF